MMFLSQTEHNLTCHMTLVSGIVIHISLTKVIKGRLKVSFFSEEFGQVRKIYVRYSELGTIYQ